MLRTVEQPGFLDQSFFQVQAVVTPTLAGQEQSYLEWVKQYQDLISERTQVFATVVQPFSEAQDLLTQKQDELEGRERFLTPLDRARVYLHEALSRNTVPWPLVWVAGRFAWEENPALSPFTKAVAASKIQLRDVTLETARQREVLTNEYVTKINAQQTLLSKEENRLLGTYELAIAKGGDLNAVSDYLTILPNGKREARSYPAVETFVHHNAFALLQTNELKGFEDYVSEMMTRSTDKKHTKAATSLKEFINMVKLALTEAEEQGTPPSSKLYATWDKYVTHRFEAYLVYSILYRLHQQDLLTNQLVIPSIIQYW